jgi:uncharacterized protein YdeI (YjbR/CyaY-like superfamily)
MTDLPENAVLFETAEQLCEWLRNHHERTTGIWLVRYKQGSGFPVLTYDEIVDLVLAFGWIDSLPRKLDEWRTMLWIAPRKPRTNWSRINQNRVQRLIETGTMAPAGLAKVEAAKADGSWNNLDEVEDLRIPEDLAQALAGYPSATTNFEQFPKSVRRGILEWICNAKRPETRAKRIQETASLAEVNRRANQWRDQ